MSIGGRGWGLRFRLTAVSVAFLLITILGLGLLFRQAMDSLLFGKTRDVLAEEWAAIKGFIRVRGDQIRWSYNPADPEEAAIVRRLQRLLLIARADGVPIQISDEYRLLNIDPLEELHRARQVSGVLERVVSDRAGRNYLVRSGTLNEIGGNQFLLSAGRPLFNDEAVVRTFTRQYFALAPLLILAMSLVAWWAAGRAIAPLRAVAETAEGIGGDNLSVTIPRRGADDELDQLIDSFNDMVRRLDDTFSQMRQFSGDVSHELRTPLTTMRGQLEVALLTATSQEQLRDAIAGAIEDIERLSSVVRSLLQLSQAESGQLHLSRETLDLSVVVAETLAELRLLAESEGLKASFNGPRRCFVDGDRIQLDRLVSNLVANAIKYTPKGGSVNVSVSRGKKRIVLEVSDTGRGIPAAHLPHIFDRFYRVPDGSPSGVRGLGLGLSFVAWIAKAHDATIDVESKAGAGTRFRIAFPEAMAPLVRTPAPQAAARAPVDDRIEA
jgi:heavy metal sensor kinase